MTRPEGTHVRGVAAVMIGLLTGLAVAFGLLWWLFPTVREPAPASLPLSDWARANLAATGHWSHQVEDLARVRRENLAPLAGYAWSDSDTTRVRIPIERAMALLAGSGRTVPAAGDTLEVAR